jgi:hypothetical protein
MTKPETAQQTQYASRFTHHAVRYPLYTIRRRVFAIKPHLELLKTEYYLIFSAADRFTLKGVFRVQGVIMNISIPLFSLARNFDSLCHSGLDPESILSCPSGTSWLIVTFGNKNMQFKPNLNTFEGVPSSSMIVTYIPSDTRYIKKTNPIKPNFSLSSRPTSRDPEKNRPEHRLNHQKRLSYAPYGTKPNSNPISPPSNQDILPIGKTILPICRVPKGSLFFTCLGPAYNLAGLLVLFFAFPVTGPKFQRAHTHDFFKLTAKINLAVIANFVVDSADIVIRS